MSSLLGGGAWTPASPVGQGAGSPWQYALGQQQLKAQQAMQGSQLASQQRLAQLSSETSKQLESMQGANAANLAGIQNAGALQRAIQEGQTAQGVATLQNQGALQRTQAEQSGQTERTKMTTEEALKAAELQKEAAELPAQLQQQRFAQVFPWLQQQYGLLTTGSGRADVNAELPPAPAVSASPVYSPQQLQGQVNQMKANTAAQSATNTRNMQADLAGRGFGANSPLAKELAAQYQGQALAANASGENNLRFQAAQANAQQVLDAQKAQAGLYGSQLGYLGQIRSAKLQQQNALLSALAGMA